MSTIELYRNTSPINALNKILTNKTEIAGNFNSDISDVTSFQIEIESIENATLYNYLFIPALSRYYFIRNYSIVSDKHVILDLTEDVLMSYREQITEQLETLKKTSEYIHRFNTPFTEFEYILTTIS